MSFYIRLVVLVFLLGIFACPSFAADPPHLNASLQGSPPLKVYFDVNLGTAKGLELRLKLINTTYEELVGLGNRPQFIVGFRGKASNFVTKGDGYVEAEDLLFKEKIAQWIKTFKDKGIRVEQCGIAAHMNGIDPQDFLSEVEVVSNGYVSMIVYQNKGFAQIPMD